MENDGAGHYGPDAVRWVVKQSNPRLPAYPTYSRRPPSTSFCCRSRPPSGYALVLFLVITQNLQLR